MFNTKTSTMSKNVTQLMKLQSVVFCFWVTKGLLLVGIYFFFLEQPTKYDTVSRVYEELCWSMSNPKGIIFKVFSHHYCQYCLETSVPQISMAQVSTEIQIGPGTFCFSKTFWQWDVHYSLGTLCVSSTKL